MHEREMSEYFVRVSQAGEIRDIWDTAQAAAAGEQGHGKSGGDGGRVEEE